MKMTECFAQVNGFGPYSGDSGKEPAGESFKNAESCVTIGVVALELGRANRLAAAFQVQPINHIDIVDVTELHFGRMIPIEAIRCTRFPNCRGYI